MKTLYESILDIDDNIDNLDNLLAKPYYERILINKPWNQWDKDWVYGIYRCNTWNEVVAAVNKICEEE